MSAAKTPRPSRKCPESFAVTAELREWASRTVPVVHVDDETAKFRDHTFRTAITDWPGAWRNWLRRAYEGRRPTSPQPLSTQARNAEARRLLGFDSEETIDA